MGVNSLPKTVTRQRRDCDLNPGPSATEFSTLTTRLPSHPNWFRHWLLYCVTFCFQAPPPNFYIFLGWGECGETGMHFIASAPGRHEP